MSTQYMDFGVGELVLKVLGTDNKLIILSDANQKIYVMSNTIMTTHCTNDIYRFNQVNVLPVERAVYWFSLFDSPSLLNDSQRENSALTKALISPKVNFITDFGKVEYAATGLSCSSLLQNALIKKASFLSTKQITLSSKFSKRDFNRLKKVFSQDEVITRLAHKLNFSANQIFDNTSTKAILFKFPIKRAKANIYRAEKKSVTVSHFVDNLQAMVSEKSL